VKKVGIAGILLFKAVETNLVYKQDIRRDIAFQFFIQGAISQAGY